MHIGERVSRMLDRLLDVLHLLGDVLGRLRGLAGELLHPARHHGEARPRVACAHRLDAGIERKQRSLPSDGLDEAHHLADAHRGLRQAAHGLVGGSEIGDGAIACRARYADIAGGAPDARQDGAGGSGDGIHVLRRRRGGIGGGCDAHMHVAVALGKVGCGVADAAAAVSLAAALIDGKP